MVSAAIFLLAAASVGADVPVALEELSLLQVSRGDASEFSHHKEGVGKAGMEKVALDAAIRSFLLGTTEHADLPDSVKTALANHVASAGLRDDGMVCVNFGSGGPAPTPAPTPDPHLHNRFLGAGGLSLQDLGCHVDSDAKLVSDADGNVDAALECPLFSSTEGCAWCPITGMPADSAPKSLTFWMKMSSDSNDAVGIVGFGTTGATNNFLVSLRKSKQLIFGWASTTKYSGLYPPVDEWCHVAFTYDGSMGTFYMRKGGGSVETAEIDVGDLTVPADSTLSLGSEVDHNEGFTGGLSDVRAYSKALTAAEVDQIYADSPRAAR